MRPAPLLALFAACGDNVPESPTCRELIGNFDATVNPSGIFRWRANDAGVLDQEVLHAGTSFKVSPDRQRALVNDETGFLIMRLADGSEESIHLPPLTMVYEWSALGIIGQDTIGMRRFSDVDGSAVTLIEASRGSPFFAFTAPDLSRVVTMISAVMIEIPIDGGADTPYGPFRDGTCTATRCNLFGFAPDGTGAFAIDTTLAFAPTEGSPTSTLFDVGPNFSARWSTLGTRLVVNRLQGPSTIVNRDGERVELDSRASAAVWSADDGELAFVSTADIARTELRDHVAVVATSDGSSFELPAPRQGLVNLVSIDRCR